MYGIKLLTTGCLLELFLLTKRKAFDHVEHTTVLVAFTATSITRRLLDGFIRFYLNVNNEHASHWSELTGGSLQSTWLGPYFFDLWP